MEERAKYLKKQNKMIYSIAKKSGLLHELKISMRSGLRIPGSAGIIAANLSEINWIPIFPYLEIDTKMNRYILLKVGR